MVSIHHQFGIGSDPKNVTKLRNVGSHAGSKKNDKCVSAVTLCPTLNVVVLGVDSPSQGDCSSKKSITSLNSAEGRNNTPRVDASAMYGSSRGYSSRITPGDSHGSVSMFAVQEMFIENDA